MEFAVNGCNRLIVGKYLVTNMLLKCTNYAVYISNGSALADIYSLGFYYSSSTRYLRLSKMNAKFFFFKEPKKIHTPVHYAEHKRTVYGFYIL
jgi:hypothetical protein